MESSQDMLHGGKTLAYFISMKRFDGQIISGKYDRPNRHFLPSVIRSYVSEQTESRGQTDRNGVRPVGRVGLPRSTWRGRDEIVTNEDIDEFKQAVQNGTGFVLRIESDLHFELFDSETCPEVEMDFLNTLVAALKLLLGRHGIGIDYDFILHQGVECTQNMLDAEGRYLVSISFNFFKIPAGMLQFICTCEVLGESQINRYSRDSSRFSAAEIQVTSVVSGQLSAAVRRATWKCTGDITTRSLLGESGSASLRRIFADLKQGKSEEHVSVMFRNTVHRVSPLYRDYGEEDALTAFEEEVKQALAINNLPHGEIQSDFTGSIRRDLLFNLNVPSHGSKGDSGNCMTIHFTRGVVETSNGGGRTKQTSVATPDTRDGLFPRLYDSQLSVHFGSWMLATKDYRTDKGGGWIPETKNSCANREDDSGRVSYLLLGLKDRGVVSNESSVRTLLRTMRHCGEVQLNLGPEWNPELTFLTQNKNMLLDMVEDLLRTVSLVVSGSTPSFQLFIEGHDSSNFPHTPHWAPVIIRSHSSEVSCRVSRDVAGQAILSIRNYSGPRIPPSVRSGRGDLKRSRAESTDESFGGIRLERGLRGAQVEGILDAVDEDESGVDDSADDDGMGEAEEDGEDDEDSYDENSGDESSSSVLQGAEVFQFTAASLR